MGRKEVRWLPQGEGKEGEAAGKKRKKEGKKEEREKLLVRDAWNLLEFGLTMRKNILQPNT